MVTENSGTDPVSVYDLVAPDFALLTAERRAYLDAIDRLVSAHLPPHAHSLLDVGAGDARRARGIAAAAGINNLVLAEPSARMRAAGGSIAEYIDLRAEHLRQLEGEFDVILCLWNVLGHVFPASARVEAMRQFRRLLSPRGLGFIDVNHRYNAARYGAVRTAARWLHDRLQPSESNGDVVATWRLGEQSAKVRGHVFTHREFVRMADVAKLSIERRFVVDYDSGAEKPLAAQGNLLYIMRRAGPS